MAYGPACKPSYATPRMGTPLGVLGLPLRAGEVVEQLPELRAQLLDLIGGAADLHLYHHPRLHPPRGVHGDALRDLRRGLRRGVADGGDGDPDLAVGFAAGFFGEVVGDRGLSEIRDEWPSSSLSRPEDLRISTTAAAPDIVGLLRGTRAALAT